MDTKRQFGELEVMVLNVLWQRKECSVKEVHQALQEKNAYTTIMTVLHRLYQKGVLDRYKEGKSYIYMVKSQQGTFAKNMIDRIKQQIFGGKSIAMVSYLFDSGNINDSDIKEMERLISNYKDSNK